VSLTHDPLASPPWARSVDQARAGVIWAVVAANVLFPLVLFLAGLPEPWDIFYGEESPINWFSSVQCAILGVWGLALFLLTRAGRSAGFDPVPRAWPWLVASLGFIFLSFDERFEIHENTRELFLKPRGWFTEIPGFKSGDVVLPFYAVAGIFLTWLLVKDLKRHPRSLVIFVSALALIVVTAVQDSLQLGIFRIPWVRHTQIVAEEVGEVWAQALFSVALALLFFDKLGVFLDALSGRARSGSGPASPA
jgi:hypothetical protein